MQVDVIMRTPHERISYTCDGDDTVYSVCDKYLRFNGHPVDNVRHHVQINVNGENYETVLSKKLCDVQCNNKVFITPFFKAGEIWQVDADGVYRYKGENI